MIKKLEKKVHEKLSEYLDFNVDNLFLNTDYAVAFGGCIRDAISNNIINDIDIMCFGHSYKTLKENLEQHNFIEAAKITSKDIMNLYSEIHIIYEPTTYIKQSNNKLQIVQLIRPAHVKQVDDKRIGYNNTLNTQIYFFENALRNVDINICGVGYSTNRGLFEIVKDSIFYILNKCFLVNDNAAMLSKNRIYGRVWKMEEKGFKCLNKSYGQDYDSFKNDDTLDKFLINLEKKRIRFNKLLKLDDDI